MVTNQSYLFLVFTINGVLIGLLFDFFRILRKSIRTSDLITYVEDIIFWILTGVIVLYSIFVFNNGELRLFVFLGILIGAIFYMFFISSYVIKINMKIINIFKKIILKPFIFLIINIRKSYTKFLKLIYNFFAKKVKNKNKYKKFVKSQK